MEISMVKKNVSIEDLMVEGRRFHWNPVHKVRPNSLLMRIAQNAEVNWEILSIEDDIVEFVKVGLSGQTLVPNEKNVVTVTSEVCRRAILKGSFVFVDS